MPRPVFFYCAAVGFLILLLGSSVPAHAQTETETPTVLPPMGTPTAIPSPTPQVVNILTAVATEYATRLPHDYTPQPTRPATATPGLPVGPGLMYGFSVAHVAYGPGLPVGGQVTIVPAFGNCNALPCLVDIRAYDWWAGQTTTTTSWDIVPIQPLGVATATYKLVVRQHIQQRSLAGWVNTVRFPNSGINNIGYWGWLGTGANWDRTQNLWIETACEPWSPRPLDCNQQPATYTFTWTQNVNRLKEWASDPAWMVTQPLPRGFNVKFGNGGCDAAPIGCLHATLTVELWVTGMVVQETYQTPTPVPTAHPTYGGDPYGTPYAPNWGTSVPYFSTPEPPPFVWNPPPATAACYNLFPGLNIDQNVLGWQLSFHVPRFEVCTAEYVYSLSLFGVDFVPFVTVVLAFGAIMAVYSIFKRA